MSLAFGLERCPEHNFRTMEKMASGSLPVMATHWPNFMYNEPSQPSSEDNEPTDKDNDLVDGDNESANQDKLGGAFKGQLLLWVRCSSQVVNDPHDDNLTSILGSMFSIYWGLERFKQTEGPSSCSGAVRHQLCFGEHDR
jgi:hypothetical protein